jgi:hypothetical protein
VSKTRVVTNNLWDGRAGIGAGVNIRMGVRQFEP